MKVLYVLPPDVSTLEWDGSPLSQDAISRRDLRLSLCLIDQVVVNSFFLKNLFVGRFFGLRLRVNVVYPGVDGSVFLPALSDRGLLRERLRQRQFWEVEPDEQLALLASAPHESRELELLLDCSSGVEQSRLSSWSLAVRPCPP